MTNITARDMVQSVGLNCHPEYYRGRGARFNDLDGTKLANIHQKIQENFGENAAKAFVTMVENVKVLSVKKFLESLYALEQNHWQFSDKIQTEINEKKENYGSMRTVYEYHESLNDDTDYIRRSFFANINGKNDLRQFRFEMYMRAITNRRDDCFGEFDDDDDDDNDDYAEYD